MKNPTERFKVTEPLACLSNRLGRMTAVSSLVHELGPVGIGIAIGIGIAASQPLFIAATQWLAMMSVKTDGRIGTGRAQDMQ